MNFGTAMTFVSLHEWANKPDGQYHNDPLDPGGETKYGISKRAHPTLDIKNLTLPQAFDIYKKEYWDACGCDHVPSGMDMCVLDAAINNGPSRALKWLKQNPTDVRAYLEVRRQFFLSLHDKHNEKGWLNRVNDLSKFVDIHK